MKMLSFVALCLASVTLSFVVPFPGRAAATPPPLLEEELVKLEKQSWAAWKNHDGKFFENFLSDDHVELGIGGPANKAQVVKSVASGMCEVKDYTLKNFALQMLAENVALLTYYESQETTCGGNAVPSPCWVSSLYMKRDGRWRNVAYQQTQAAK
jgi:hypothetical protein